MLFQPVLFCALSHGFALSPSQLLPGLTLDTAGAVTQPASAFVHPAVPLDLLAGSWSFKIFSAVDPCL